ncbi:tudor domain-containing protein 5-like isoform X2 [Rhynchophorus ferrugineus]|uniref:tudor domain-containing protein 5-like isoform X2 n=1 Tax=Rhynchophorus ferrugineus TaxID=354439 RepID=UPI003FCC497D
MKNFYRRKEVQKEYSVHIPVIQESLNCVTLICGEYHRARILEVILNSNEARVFCIDYGRVCKVHFSGIYFLKTDFAELPAQAIRCQLHHIAPKLRNRIWPRSSCTAFKEMVNRKNIKMKIVYVNWDEESTGVLLTDITDVDNTYNVNEEVVNKGFGYWENQSIYPPLKLGNSTSNVERLYFFPMFLELELGFAPSASEIQ